MKGEKAETDARFMALAMEEARLAADAGEMPVGCVVVREGKVIARAHNECEQRQDATAHAELLAIRRASEALGSWRLEGCTLYVTLEPCPMCAGALVQARVDRLVFDAANPEQGCAGSLYRIPEDPAFSHHCLCEGGVLAGECGRLLKAFFEGMRSRA